MTIRFTPRLPDRPWTMPIGMLTSAAVAGVVGWFASKRYYANREVLVEEEVVEEDPQLTLDFDVTEINVLPGGSFQLENFPQAPKSTTTVFIEHDDGWDHEVQAAQREGQRIYQINYQEFWNNEFQYDQETATYYKKDDVLADAVESPIDNYASLFGTFVFGLGTDNPNVAYVRNHDLEMEWEILLDEGSYAEEVLGQTIAEEIARGDLKHSVQKFRWD
jgi:hypothetical protein